MKKLRAIDLYSGVGGWTLGLKMAGIEVVRSYEWWPVANATHDVNFGTRNDNVDIRRLDVETLPRDIDIVVGSPPCTQFSFSNRGGSGDLNDGLIDIRKFLEVVRSVKPRIWAMENVPRVADVLRTETGPGGRLAEFADLFSVIDVFDMSSYGLPQRRSRTIAGHFPVDCLYSYEGEFDRRTLGDVIRCLAAKPPLDPVYRYSIQAELLSDNIPDARLSVEEERMNRESKTYHPVYNRMAFPDPLDETARTVTATCTRVSRESCVIAESNGGFRRLSVRERASLQGFPISFVFAGERYGDRVKQIGNAIPPLFTFLLAQSFQEKAIDAFVFPPDPRKVLLSPENWRSVNPGTASKSFRSDRRFAAAVPGLRFGSGMRFDFTNRFDPNGIPKWLVEFHFGPSKDIQVGPLNKKVLESILSATDLVEFRAAFMLMLQLLESDLGDVDPIALQLSWTRRAARKGPYEVVDQLALRARELVTAIGSAAHLPAVAWIQRWLGMTGFSRSAAKLERNAVSILAGALLGSWLNAHSSLSSSRNEATESQSELAQDLFGQANGYENSPVIVTGRL
jgi:DNA (cytosine-5)-methyltransferase 1